MSEWCMCASVQWTIDVHEWTMQVHFSWNQFFYDVMKSHWSFEVELTFFSFLQLSSTLITLTSCEIKCDMLFYSSKKQGICMYVCMYVCMSENHRKKCPREEGETIYDFACRHGTMQMVYWHLLRRVGITSHSKKCICPTSHNILSHRLCEYFATLYVWSL